MSREESLSWDDLRYVEAVDRLGTAGRAARELGVSASTVYRRIALLESRVGAQCILPGTGAGRLTDAGRELAAIARQTEASIGELSRKLRTTRERVAGEVSVTTVEGFIPLIAGPLTKLARTHPDLRVVLHIGEQGPSVRRREVDIAIGVMPRPSESLWGRKILTIDYGVFATRDAAQQEPIPWIVLAPPLHRTPQAEWETEHAERIAVRTASLQATIALCREGAGAAVLPRRLAARFPDLVEVPAYAKRIAELQRPTWLLTHPDVQDEPRIRAVMAALSEGLSQP
jgi:DNA-binding transcriptional LysR family regulator